MISDAPTHPIMPLVAAGCAALAAWCSIGVQAVLDTPAGLERVGLLPSWWLLLVLVAASVGLAWLVRLSSRTALPLFSSLLLLLPWLPGRVPAAFLLWTGHVAAAVWIAVALAMLLAHEKGAGLLFLRAQPLKKEPSPFFAAAVACVLYISTASHLSGIIPGGD